MSPEVNSTAGIVLYMDLIEEGIKASVEESRCIETVRNTRT